MQDSREQSRNSLLAGVLPVFQMPYHEDESIDWDTLEKEIHWLIDRGARGVVMAMVSEMLRLSTDERRAVAEFTCRVVAGRGTAVISVGAECSYTAVELAKHAEACHATAIMATPPFSIAIGDEEHRIYFRRIADAVRIPLIIQDASGYVGRPMSVGVLTELLFTYGPDRVLFKPEATPIGPNLTVLREATYGKARVFEGSGGIALVDSYRRGIVGTMPGADLIDAVVALWKALVTGNEERMYQLSLPLSSLVALQTGLDGFLTVEKYLLKKQGVFKNCVVRGPVGFRLDNETRHEVDRLFERLMRAVVSVGAEAVGESIHG